MWVGRSNMSQLIQKNDPLQLKFRLQYLASKVYERSWKLIEREIEIRRHSVIIGDHNYTNNREYSESKSKNK